MLMSASITSKKYFAGIRHSYTFGMQISNPMPINLNISDEIANQILQVFRSQLEDNRTALELRLKEIEQLNEKNRELSVSIKLIEEGLTHNGGNNTSKQGNAYLNQWTTFRKIW